MFGKNKTQKDKLKGIHFKRSKRQTKRKARSVHDDIIVWADRIIEEKGTNEKSRRPGVSRGLITVTIILTLTVLTALVAHFCIYK